MNKLQLKDFEFNINATTWNVAQDLAQAGAVQGLRELERHFWTAKVTDSEGEWENEIIISPSRIKEFACTCWSAPRKTMCAHIAATTLKIRQFLQQKAEDKARQASEKKQPDQLTRLTIREVLHDVSVDALSAFVKHYAHRDRDFAMALKTWFAGSVKNTDNPFMLVLDSALPAPGKPIKEADFRRIRRTLDDLTSQMSTRQEQGQLADVVKIATAILLKTSPVLPKLSEAKTATATDYIRQALETLGQLIRQEHISPELRRKIKEDLLGCISTPMPSDDIVRMVVDLITLSPDSVMSQLITDRFMQQEGSMPYPVALMYCTLLARQQLADGIPRVLNHIDHVHAEPVVWKAIIDLFYLKEWQATSVVIRYFTDKKPWTASQRNELEQLEIQIADKTNNLEEKRRLLRQRYLRSGDRATLEQIRSMSGDQWEQELFELTEIMRNKSTPVRVAQLLADAGQFVILEEYLTQVNDFDTIRQLEQQLSDAFLTEKYVHFCAEYLDAHFGQPASAQVRRWMEDLAGHQRIALVRAIADNLTRQFPERTHLPEELVKLWEKKTLIKNWS